jgi:hypothetical protein
MRYRDGTHEAYRRLLLKPDSSARRSLPVAPGWLVGAVGLAAALAAFLPSSLAAQTCVDYSLHPAAISSMGTRGAGMDFVRRGNYAYVADGAAGITVVDISDLGSPRIVGHLPTDYAFSEVTIGNYLFAADNGVDIIDVANPNSPVVVGSLGRHRKIEAFGDYLLGVSSQGSLVVIDVSDPARPVTVASRYLGSIWDIAIDGTLAFVGARESLDAGAKLHIVDLTTPANPEVRGALDLRSFPRRLSVDGTIVYSSSWTSGVDVIDVHDPTEPRLLTHLDIQFEYFVAEDGRACGVNPGLWFYDLTDPVSPRLVANAYIPGHPTTVLDHPHYSLATIDDHVLVLRSGGPPARGTLSTFRLGDTTPPEVPETEVEFPVVNAFLERDNGVAYVGTPDNLAVYDVLDPLHPLELLRVPASTAIAALELSGDILVGGTWSEAGFEVVLFDVSRPRTPVELGRTRPIRPTDQATALDLLIKDTHVYVTSYEEFAAAWLTIVDIAARNAPKVVGRIDLHFWGGWEGTAWSGPRLAASGGHLFVTRSRGFGVYSLVDPVNIVEVGSYYRPWHMSSGIEIVGSRMYLSMHARHEWYNRPPPVGTELRPGLHVFDVSSPTTPTEITFVETVNHADRLVVRHALKSGGDLALIGVETSGVHAYALVDTDQPAHLGYWMRPQDGEFTVVGSSIYAFVPRAPNVTVAGLPCAGEVPVYLNAFDTRVVDGTVHLRWQVDGAASAQDFRLIGSSGNDRWEVGVTSAGGGAFEATDLAAAHEPIGSGQSRRIQYDLYTSAIGSDWQFLASRDVDTSHAPQTRLAGASPNPFNPATLVRYELRRAGPVELVIFDVRGHAIRTLVRGPRDSGHHAVRWDGRDANGREVASGVYRIRLLADRHSDSEWLVLVR